jgi:epoxyqueuosine reductase QueG
MLRLYEDLRRGFEKRPVMTSRLTTIKETNMLAKPRYKVVGNRDRFDERDNVQSRNTFEPGSEEYREFYKRHPEWEEKDAEIREISRIPVGNALDLPLFFSQIGNLARCGAESLVDGPVSPEKLELSPERATEKIKGFARHLGADLVRITPLNPAHIYTHIGKTWQDPARKYGASINLNHKNAIVIAVAIDPALIKTGPVLPMISAVMRVYTQLAVISTTLAGYIRGIGFPARAHIISNYQVLCVPLAIDAGMGELGRHGVMLTKEFGSSLKLTVVTTDLPLLYDPPVDIGVDEFCRDCKICAESCPSAAISHGEKRIVRGVEKWAINPEACFKVWKETGTDCGVCIASCPWTRPRKGIHRIAAALATRKKKAGWWMSHAEKLVYGKFRPQPVPTWFEEPPPIWKKYKALQ